ncbi:MAG: hypothetical protein ACRD1T_08560, partial [Acidimicrobiia bacterium]
MPEGAHGAPFEILRGFPLTVRQGFYLFALVVFGVFSVPGGMAGFQPDRTSTVAVRNAGLLRNEPGQVGAVASPTALWEESPARQRGRAAWARIAYVDSSGRYVT